jgi:hypothetical protein
MTLGQSQTLFFRNFESILLALRSSFLADPVERDENQLCALAPAYRCL